MNKSKAARRRDRRKRLEEYIKTTGQMPLGFNIDKMVNDILKDS